MTSPSSTSRSKSDLLALLGTVPAGYVTTHSDVARHLSLQHRHVIHILAMLDDAEREATGWWRLVADGGAVGRHAWRDLQVARLRDDGVPLSGAAIVQELTERRVKDLTHPPAGPLVRHTTGAAGPAGRSRGMKSHPAK